MFQPLFRCARPFGFALILLCQCVMAAQSSVTLFDANTHLLRPAAVADETVALFKSAGIARVIIMDPEPADLQAFAGRHGDFAVPFINVSRTPATHGLKYDANTADAITELVNAGNVCGVGELPLRTVPASDPTDAASLHNPHRLKIYALADRRHLPVSFHVQLSTPEIIDAVDKLASRYSHMRMIIAHAGSSTAPEELDKLLDRRPNLYFDLSLRLDPALGWQEATATGSQANPLSILNAQGALLQGWRRLIERHPDRFLFATGISEDDERKARVAELVRVARQALADLPLAEQAAIGHVNLQKLLDHCPAVSVLAAPAE